MSNPETHPVETVCRGDQACPEPLEVLAPREVPLGGPRAMRVRRTLPQRKRSMIGAWCFCDHYGPEQVVMNVPVHPHTGLATVSWLFTGTVEHRDSIGTHAMVRPGELNLMTAGHGISHSERSTADTTVLHGTQLWVALPAEHRDDRPRFDHYAPPAVTAPGVQARVFLGSLLGSTSPVATATPLLGAELILEPGSAVSLDLDAAFEHGVLVDTGRLMIAGGDVTEGQLAYLPTGTDRLTLTAVATRARVLLLGGPPFGEQIVMWWNFVGRSHEEIVAFRNQWQAEIGRGDPGHEQPPRFALPDGDPEPPLPAPTLPNARIRPRPPS